MVKLLSEFRVGERGVIRLVTGEGAIRLLHTDGEGLGEGAELVRAFAAGGGGMQKEAPDLTGPVLQAFHGREDAGGVGVVQMRAVSFK